MSSINYGLGDWGPCLEIRSSKQTGPEKPIPLTHMHVISVMSCHVWIWYMHVPYSYSLLNFFESWSAAIAVLYSFSCSLYTILANGKPKANNSSCTKNVYHKHGHTWCKCVLYGHQPLSNSEHIFKFWGFSKLQLPISSTTDDWKVKKSEKVQHTLNVVSWIV